MRQRKIAYIYLGIALFCSTVEADVAMAQKLRVAYTAFAGTFTILWVSVDDGVARHVLKKHRLQPNKDVALLQLGGTQEIIAGMQNNLVQGGSISLPLTVNARKLGFRELMTTEAIGLPFDYGCFIVKNSHLKSRREELKKVLRATIAAYDLAIADPAFAKRTVGKYTRTTDAAILDETYKENVKEYALRVPYVSLAGLSSILEFRAETAAEVKKLQLEKMYDNSLLQEIQKEAK